jgi:hypothetical protein
MEKISELVTILTGQLQLRRNYEQPVYGCQVGLVDFAALNIRVIHLLKEIIPRFLGNLQKLRPGVRPRCNAVLFFR